MRDGALLRATDRQERTAPGRKEAFHFKNGKGKGNIHLSKLNNLSVQIWFFFHYVV